MVVKDFNTIYGSFHMALILSCYSYLHWQNGFPTFLFPQLKSTQTVRIVSLKITISVLLLTIYIHFVMFFGMFK